MSELNSGDFSAFFHALHGYNPFPWQQRLADQVCGGEWPKSIDLPTASGKTACIDIAVFAMAVTGKGPRRVFFVVDRRVVVDAAFERMQTISQKLHEAEAGVLREVGDRLRQMGQSDCPLQAFQMRGGIYRDDSWVRSPLQPAAIASTVDQVGSRLLFRGYGVWDKTLPLHAALVANDALIFLDEAHCSQAFAKTLDSIRRYREWADEKIGTRFAFVEMTATPVCGNGEKPFQLEQADYEHEELRKRLFAPKRVQLTQVKARARDWEKLAHELAEQAEEMAQQPGLRRIAVMVNRVRTAKLVHDQLKQRHADTQLLIGRMRPVDRFELGPLEGLLAGQKRTEGSPMFVVATQCLEVGADLDFDAIVSECASIDALMQRFGRLDRIGDLSKSGVQAQGCVTIAAALAASGEPDAIYGEALGNTWRWLTGGGDSADFGICSADGSATVRERLNAGEPGGLRLEAPPGPTLLPAHLDALAQTFPRPALEPDLELFLHGKREGSPEVQVVWRADLEGYAPKDWAEVVAVCPPVSAEAMAVPLWDFRRWLNEEEERADSSDLEGAGDGEGEKERVGARRVVLRWRGDNSDLVGAGDPKEVRPASDLRPGDTLVVPESYGGWNELGHVPETKFLDAAERARDRLRRPWVLRLHKNLMAEWPEKEAKAEVVRLMEDPAAKEGDIRDALRAYNEQLDEPRWLKAVLERLPERIEAEVYPAGEDGHYGWVLHERWWEADSGQDESSAGSAVPLDRHLSDVTEAVRNVAAATITDAGLQRSLERAARLHDCGKADPRFQALLHGGDPMRAQFAPRLLAKGEAVRGSRSVRQRQWERSGLPDGFRHELISLLLAGRDGEVGQDELALHLIASHHGRCRPFAPVVEDTGPDLSFNGWRITAAERAERAAHRLDSGVADRFWRLTRRYGWWGLAYLEALMRLGDWDASAGEEKQ